MRTILLIFVCTLLLAASAGQGQFNISGVGLDPPALTGNCHPTHVHFVGRIIGTGPGEAAYEWLRSDHGTSPVHHLRFTKQGAMPVSYDWAVSATTHGWVVLHVISPRDVKTRNVTFTVNCGR